MSSPSFQRRSRAVLVYFGLAEGEDSSPPRWWHGPFVVLAGVVGLAWCIGHASERHGTAGGVVVGMVAVVGTGLLALGQRGDPPLRERRPWLDAAGGILIGVLLAFTFVPSRSTWVCLAVAAAYAALIFAATARRLRQAPRAGTQPDEPGGREQGGGQVDPPRCPTP